MRGAVIKCPNCGATVNHLGNVVRCDYCNTQVRVQLRTGFFERVQTPRQLPPQVLNLPVAIQAHSKQWVVGALIAPMLLIGAVSFVGAMVMKKRAENNPAVASLKKPTWDGKARAVARDVNGDGVMDAVGVARILTPKHTIYYAAYSGTDGKRLWLTPSLGLSSNHSNTAAGYTKTHLLASTKSGHVFAFKLKDGTLAWKAKFPERVERYCAGDADHVVIELKDKSRSFVRLADGANGKAEPSPCISVQTDLPYDFSPEQEVQGIRYDNETPPGSSEHEGMNIDGAVRLGGAKRLAYGYKSPGTRTPMVALYTIAQAPDGLDYVAAMVKADGAEKKERWKLLRAARAIESELKKIEKTFGWSSIIPGTDPLKFDEHDPERHLAFGEDAIVAAYEVEDGNSSVETWRLTSLATSDGARQWDVVVPGKQRLSSISMSDSLVFVSKWSSLLAFDKKTGALRWSSN